ncbi:hypothetical protein [Dyella sp.]|uniref:hypothetical protein n=1 Tax=Dyella sp. TaxID=1869338 RepID=UPI002D780061|nr:hypothetical protein [Dyella sp.]HET6433510.1 hypothetical protein [Dyella sp.]
MYQGFAAILRILGSSLWTLDSASESGLEIRTLMALQITKKTPGEPSVFLAGFFLDQ